MYKILKTHLVHFLLFVVLAFTVNNLKAQQVVTNEIFYRTYQQSMWQEGEAFTIDFNFDLFQINESGQNNMGSIQDILGAQFRGHHQHRLVVAFGLTYFV